MSTPDEKQSARQRNRVSLAFRSEVKPDDPEYVRRIVVSSGFFQAEEILVAVELVQERLEKGFRCGYHFIFAESHGAPVGYTCFGPIACTKGSYDLYWIAVIDEFRGRGIGSDLLAGSLREIRNLGGVRVYVETSSRAQYDPTRSFYRKHGFKEQAMLQDFYDIGDHKVVYTRSIG